VKIFFLSALLSWALGFVFSVLLELPPFIDEDYVAGALNLSLQADVLLLGFSTVFFALFLRGRTSITTRGKHFVTYGIAACFWSFFWSLLLGLNDAMHGPYGTGVDRLLPIGFTIASVFILVAFAVQYLASYEEKESSTQN